ncbi:nucleotidyl transferase AbiEii/AbiGii toxin family protein [Sphingobacterium sp. SG20118]|uniref:nucleotidyl transferase AbiEii/AbiGii toxin family protein n=1 Tax=Sphingobacterium sp. SG20118 TaxID=3367156 RepID=UPI0037DFC3F7
MIVSEQKGIDPILIEKDYWIMHCLFALKQAGYVFELKGGTSLSKAFKIIDRFSEDIDIHIHPPVDLEINENPKNYKPSNSKKRLNFYNNLAKDIKIDGIIDIIRDTSFDDLQYYRSGGIRLIYSSLFKAAPGIKEGVLLEVGFDNINPNKPIDITSWIYDTAKKTQVKFIDNNAVAIPCYDMRYTFVEKLQTIATKFRVMQQTNTMQVNFMRQYYDVYKLLQQTEIQNFIGSNEYYTHKERRFPAIDFAIPMNENQAFLIHDKQIEEQLDKLYINSNALYYNGQPDFKIMVEHIKSYLDLL